MKKILNILILLALSHVAFSQKTAQEYFNVSARLYAEKQQQQALYVVSRGCEIYEADSALAQLKRLIEGNGEQNQQNQQQKNQNKNQQNDQQNQDQSGNGNSQNGDKKEQSDQNKGNQETPQNGENQQDNEKQEQGKESQSGKQGQQDKNPTDKKGQISEIQAEMMLDAIENNDKAVQQRLMLQRQNKKSHNKIDKNW